MVKEGGGCLEIISTFAGTLTHLVWRRGTGAVLQGLSLPAAFENLIGSIEKVAGGNFLVIAS